MEGLWREEPHQMMLNWQRNVICFAARADISRLFSKQHVTVKQTRVNQNILTTLSLITTLHQIASLGELVKQNHY